MSERTEWVRGIRLAAIVATLLLWIPAARAEATAEPEPPLPWQPGPLHVDLGHDLGVDLSERYMFLPKDAAARVLERMGSFYNDDLLGLAASVEESADWFVVLRYEPEGYVADAEPIDAEELLSALREGTAAANPEREERGFKPLTLEGWAEPPQYDRAQHRLVWALIVSDADGKSVNYNTRVLGRRGYASLNLVTDPSQLQAYKPEASALLASTAFVAGARYEDFDSSTDKTAEYGLAGLIAAGAGLGASKLVKIGLLAKFWKVLLAGVIAGKKAILLALAAAGAAVKRWMGGRKAEAEAAKPGSGG